MEGSGIYKLRMPEELYRLLCATALECSRFVPMDVCGIVRKSVKWASSKGMDFVVQIEREYPVPQKIMCTDASPLDAVEKPPMPKAKVSETTVQVRDCPKPKCTPAQMRSILAYRCIDALGRIKSMPEPFTPPADAKYIIRDAGDE